MRSGTATTRRVRLVIALSVAVAVTVMIGAILIAASVVMRMVTKHQPAHMTRLGLDVVAAGIAFGPVLSGPALSGPALSRAVRSGVVLSGAEPRRPAATPGATAARGPGGRPC